MITGTCAHLVAGAAHAAYLRELLVGKGSAPRQSRAMPHPPRGIASDFARLSAVLARGRLARSSGSCWSARSYCPNGPWRAARYDHALHPGAFPSLSCLAEELALRLPLSEAKVMLFETFDLGAGDLGVDG